MRVCTLLGAGVSGAALVIFLLLDLAEGQGLHRDFVIAFTGAGSASFAAYVIATARDQIIRALRAAVTSRSELSDALCRFATAVQEYGDIREADDQIGQVRTAADRFAENGATTVPIKDLRKLTSM